MYDLTALIRDPDTVAALRAAIYDDAPVTRLRDAKIKVTARCNLRCAFCPTWRMSDPVELSTAELLRTIDDLAALDCRKVHLSGGEPTLRADLPAIVAHAAERGMRVALTTNGTLLTEELAAALLAAGAHSVAVSLDDASPAAHDRLRGVRGAFKRTLRGLKNLARTKKRLKAKTRLRVNMVLTQHNYHAYPEVLALAGALGATDVTPLPVDEGGRSKNRLLGWQLREYNDAVAPAVAALRAQFGFAAAPQLIYPFGQHGDDLHNAVAAEYARGYYRDHLCYAPWLTTLIAGDGGVWPCCMSRGKIPPLGNVRETSFQRLFAGEAYHDFRRRLRETRFPLCRRCDNYLAENNLLASALRVREEGG